MTTAVFTVWLLLSYSNDNGAINLHGQYWSAASCQADVELRAKANRVTPLRYSCQKITIPEGGK